MAIYYVHNVSANKYLTVDGLGNGSLSNPHKLMLYTPMGISAQRWSIGGLLTATTTFRSTPNLQFGLNAYRVGTNWTCNLHTVSGNETDAAITVERSGNHYRIRLTNYANRYLTAEGINNGAGVYWAAATGGSNQLWKIETVNPSESQGTLPAQGNINMPVNANQKDPSVPKWVRDYGCAVCCLADVASYYSPNQTNYTVQDMINCGAGAESGGAYFGKAPNVGFLEYTGSSFLEVIKVEIAQRRPVVIHCRKYNEENQHWVVAFAYQNSAATFNDITVLDPAGDSADGPIGKVRTLSEAMNHSNGLNYINCIRMTYAK